MQAIVLWLVEEPTGSLDLKTTRQIRRLRSELVRERGRPALVNIHDVAVAQTYADKIIGLRGGEIVFAGVSNQVTEAVLTDIYGEEYWSTTIRKLDENG